LQDGAYRRRAGSAHAAESPIGDPEGGPRPTGRRKILSSVIDFAAKLKQAGPDALGFLYYSGHGVSRPDDRVNYVIPTDLQDLNSRDAWIDAVSLDAVLSEPTNSMSLWGLFSGPTAAR